MPSTGVKSDSMPKYRDKMRLNKMLYLTPEPLRKKMYYSNRHTPVTVPRILFVTPK